MYNGSTYLGGGAYNEGVLFPAGVASNTVSLGNRNGGATSQITD